MAFAPQPYAFSFRPAPVAGHSVLYERPDASAAIAHALEMSKTFGPTSKEAALAWDIVEELDSSDNRFVSSTLFDVWSLSDGFHFCVEIGTVCIVTLHFSWCAYWLFFYRSAAFKESSETRVKYDKSFDDKLKLLSNILRENEDKVKKIKSLAQEIQAIKLVKPQASKPGPDSPQLVQALQEAKEATEKYGNGSKEAVQAWMTVEEIASDDLAEATSGTLDEECLIQTIEAVRVQDWNPLTCTAHLYQNLRFYTNLFFLLILQCEALEEINRIVDLQKHDGSRYSGWI